MRDPTPIRPDIQAFLRVHQIGLDRNRPYLGQEQTLNGTRGTQRLPPITLRDLADVMVAALRTVPDEGPESWRSWSDETLARNVCVALEEEFPEHFPWIAADELD